MKRLIPQAARYRLRLLRGRLHRQNHPGAEADLAAGMDAIGAVYPEGQLGVGDFRDFHLLVVADADQHCFRRVQRAQGVAERGQNP